MTSSPKRILLWAVPRSLSTAMCRVMMNSGLKTQILFEPYNASYYFAPERGSERFKHREVDPKYSYENVKRAYELPYSDKELVFAKDMPYHLNPDRLTADWIPDGYMHTFITRHPRSTIASHFKMIDKQLPGWTEFDPREHGFKEQVEVLHLVQQQGHKVVVLDADDLAEKPEKTLRAYCQEVGLEFRSSMLNWEPLSDEDFQDTFSLGPRFDPEWFLNMKTSTTIAASPRRPPAASFTQYDQETRDLIETLVADSMVYYEEMRSLCIRV